MWIFLNCVVFTTAAKVGDDDDGRNDGVGMAEFLLAAEHNVEQDKGDQPAQDKGGKLEHWPLWNEIKKNYDWEKEQDGEAMNIITKSFSRKHLKPII